MTTDTRATILIVDDDPNNLFALNELLSPPIPGARRDFRGDGVPCGHEHAAA